MSWELFIINFFFDNPFILVDDSKFLRYSVNTVLFFSSQFWKGVTNCEYYCAKVQDCIQDIVHNLDTSDVVAILDPPRAGIRKWQHFFFFSGDKGIIH